LSDRAKSKKTASRRRKKEARQASEPAKVGRPTAYKDTFPEQALKLCKLGATDADLADFFEVSIRTVENWRAGHPEFFEATKIGKAEADDQIERSLYLRAKGYTYDAVKIMQYEGSPVLVPYREHVPPDTTAAIFWLKNRRKDDWRDKQTHEHTADDPLTALLLQVHANTAVIPSQR
jgi:hypothetical protein